MTEASIIKLHVGEHGDRKQQKGTGVRKFNKGR